MKDHLGYITSTLDILCAACAYEQYFYNELVQMHRENGTVKPEDVCERCRLTFATSLRTYDERIEHSKIDADTFVQAMREHHQALMQEK